MWLSKVIGINWTLLATACVALTGLSGCESSPEEVIQTLCHRDFAQFEAQFVAARIALEPWRREKQTHAEEADLVSEEFVDDEVEKNSPYEKGRTTKVGRSLASLDQQEPEKELSSLQRYAYLPLLPKDRELWQEWSRTRLDEVQHWQDIVTGRPQFRAEFHDLSQMANEIVAVHGFANSGSVQGIFRSLYSIQEQTQKLQARLCHR